MSQTSAIKERHSFVVGKPIPRFKDGTWGQDYPKPVLDLIDWVNQQPLIEGKSVLRVAVISALRSSAHQVIANYGIKDTDEVPGDVSFYQFASNMLSWIPTEDADSRDVYDVICTFYYILDQPSMVSGQTPILPSSVGKALTPLSQWISDYAKAIGSWMSDPESLTADSYATLKKAKKYEPEEWLEPVPGHPTGGFKCYNEFFYRQLKPGLRPIPDPKNDKMIVFPADSAFAYSDVFPVSEGSNPPTITIKGIPWSINDLLGNDANLINTFAGGGFVHSFLSTFNWHRQTAPVSGYLVYAEPISGAAYLNVTANENGMLKKRRLLRDARPRDGVDGIIFPDPPPTEDPHAPDNAGYQFLQSRYVFVIESPYVGPVAVLPIGMAQVSSIVPLVKAVKPSKWINQGEEISYFQFGGSDIIMLFSKQAGLGSKVVPPPPDKNREYNLANSKLVEASSH